MVIRIEAGIEVLSSPGAVRKSPSRVVLRSVPSPSSAILNFDVQRWFVLGQLLVEIRECLNPHPLSASKLVVWTIQIHQILIPIGKVLNSLGSTVCHEPSEVNLFFLKEVCVT